MIGREERLVALLALLAIVVFLALNLHYAEGLVLPLDDSYIHAQYARSIADGHAFRYTPGSEPSLGLTGLLYSLLLAPLYKIGLRGDALPAAMFVINAILLVLSAVLVYRVALLAGRREVALLAAALYALSGPLAWGYLSGMEVGLFCTLWLAVAWALLLDAPRYLAIWATALAWVRPEGWLWCWALAIGAPWLSGRRSRWASARWSRWLPVFLGALPLMVNLVIGGSLSPASARPKSPLHLPDFHLPTMIQHVVGFLVTVVKGLLTGVGGPQVSGALNQLDSWSHAAPFTLLLILLALAGARVAGRREERPSAGPALFAWGAWAGIHVLWVAVTTGSSGHYFRHLLPSWPAIILLTAVGVHAAAETLGRGDRAKSTLRRTLSGYLLAFAALGTITFALLYGQQARAFARQYRDTALWISRSLPTDARVASLDAGFLGYYGEREFFDLFGLTTPSMHGATVFYADDEGTKCEIMESLPPSDRPTHFALHEVRFDHENWNPYIVLAARDSGGRPRVVHESRMLVDYPRVGTNFQVWEADWRLANSGDLPGDPGAAARVIDRVDIADPESERAHQVRLIGRAPGFFGRNRYDRLLADDGREVVDGGRAIAGRLEMKLAGVTPGADVELRLRTLSTPFDEPLSLTVEGRHLGEVALPPSTGHWRESSLRLPGTAITTDEIDLTIEGVLMLYHVWLLAPEGPPVARHLPQLD